MKILPLTPNPLVCSMRFTHPLIDFTDWFWHYDLFLRAAKQDFDLLLMYLS